MTCAFRRLSRAPIPPEDAGTTKTAMPPFLATFLRSRRRQIAAHLLAVVCSNRRVPVRHLHVYGSADSFVLARLSSGLNHVLVVVKRCGHKARKKRVTSLYRFMVRLKLGGGSINLTRLSRHLRLGRRTLVQACLMCQRWFPFCGFLRPTAEGWLGLTWFSRP